MLGEGDDTLTLAWDGLFHYQLGREGMTRAGHKGRKCRNSHTWDGGRGKEGEGEWREDSYDTLCSWDREGENPEGVTRVG